MDRTRSSLARRGGLASLPLFSFLLLVLVALAATAPLGAEDAPGTVEREPGAHALVDVRIVQGPGRVIESGTLVIRDGVIEAVGADVEVPADARVWEFGESGEDGGEDTGDDSEDNRVTLYPGLVESFHPVALPEAEEDDAAPAGADPNARVRPERDATPHAYDEKAYEKLRQAGFTTAVMVPEPGIFRGRSVAVSLGSGGLRHNLLRRDVAQNVQLETGSFGGGYPTSTMGAVALVRQRLIDAAWHADARAAWEENPAQRRPEYSVSLAALEDAAAGRETVVFESDDANDLLRLARIADEFGLDAAFVGGGDEYRWLDEVAAALAENGEGRHLILPILFPEPPTVGEEDDLEIDLETLRHWKLAPENPLRLHEAGVGFSLTSHHLGDAKKLHQNLAQAIERGLPADVALAALTTVPAEELGLERVVGTLDPGKAANVLVVEGDLFREKTTIRDVWVDGRVFELRDVEPPTVEPAGTWEMTISAAGGAFQLPVTIELAGAADDLSGTLTSPQGELPISSAEVSGATVYLEVDMSATGASGMLTVNMTIDGETAKGSGTSPQGDFEISGRRTAKPDPEWSLTQGAGR